MSTNEVIKTEEDSIFLRFRCPGCNRIHSIPYEGSNAWEWNRDKTKPTISPSILGKWNMWEPPVTPENHEEFRKNPWKQKQVEHVCHSFVRDGMIQFLDDCTHKLRGQTVPLPAF